MTLTGKFNLFHLVVQITAAIDVKMDKSAHDKKSSFKILRLILSFGPYIVYITKTACKKVRALIGSLKFSLGLYFISLAYDVVLYGILFSCLD